MFKRFILMGLLIVLLSAQYSLGLSQIEPDQRPSSVLFYDNDDNLSHYEAFYYDNTGNITKILTYDALHQIKSKSLFHYGKKNILEKIHLYNKEGVLLKTTSLTYNNQHQIEKILVQNEKSKTTTTFNYAYNKLNQIQAITEETDKPTYYQLQFIYEKNSYPLLIKIFLCYKEEKKCGISISVKSEYTPDGYIKTHLFFQESDQQLIFKSVTQFEEGTISPHAKMLFNSMIEDEDDEN